MFIEFQTNSTGTGQGLIPFANIIDYAMTNTAESLSTAQPNLSYYQLFSDANPGAWTRRVTVGTFSAVNNYWAWSQSVTGKPDQAFFHKGFALRYNTDASSPTSNNYYQGYMGAFQDPASRTTFAAFDFARPLNHNFTTNTTTAVRYDTLSGSLRAIYLDRFIVSAANGYLFIGNVTQGTFWAVCNGTALPIHQFSTSASIPMIGLTGLGDISTGTIPTRHDLRVHVHKYDSGSGTAYNQLSSFDQQLNSDSTAAPNNTNFLNLYPSSLANQGFLDRYDADGKKTTAIYPIIIGNPIKGNAYQTVDGLVILSGQNHETGQTFYIGANRYYKFVCTHDRTSRQPAFAGLTIGVPIR